MLFLELLLASLANVRPALFAVVTLSLPVKAVTAKQTVKGQGFGVAAGSDNHLFAIVGADKVAVDLVVLFGVLFLEYIGLDSARVADLEMGWLSLFLGEDGAAEAGDVELPLFVLVLAYLAVPSVVLFGD